MENNDLYALLEEACISKDVVDKFDGKFMLVSKKSNWKVQDRIEAALLNC